MDKVEKEVCKILKGILTTSEQITLKSDLRDDLGMDSLNLMTLGIELANKAKVDVLKVSTEIDLMNIYTVEDVVTLYRQIKEDKHFKVHE